MENFDISITASLRGTALKEIKKLLDLKERISNVPVRFRIIFNHKKVLSDAVDLKIKLYKILSPLIIKTKIEDPPMKSSIKERTSAMMRTSNVTRSPISTRDRWRGYSPDVRGVPFMNRRVPVREAEDLLYRPTYTIAAMYSAVALYPIKLASEYEDALLQLDKAWQRIGDSSSVALKNMRDQLMDIEGISGKDAIALATEVAKQGISDAKLITNLVKELAVSTEALEIPAQTAASYIAKILDINTLQMTQDNVRKVTDLLAHLSNTMSGVKPPDLVEVWKRSSKALAHLNMELDEQAALSAAVLQTGISKYFSGSEIKKFTRRLASPVLNKDKESLKELGLDRSGLQMLNMIREEGAQGLIKVIQMFNKLSDVQREKALGMAGKQLVESMRGEKQLDKLRKALDLASNSAGASAEEFRKYSKTFTAKSKEAMDTLHSFFLALGDPLMEFLKPILWTIGKLGASFRILNETLGKFSSVIFGTLGVYVAARALNKVFTLFVPKLSIFKKSVSDVAYSLNSASQSVQSSAGVAGKSKKFMGLSFSGWAAAAFAVYQLADALLPLEEAFSNLTNWVTDTWLRLKETFTRKDTVTSAREEKLKSLKTIYKAEFTKEKTGIGKQEMSPLMKSLVGSEQKGSKYYIGEKPIALSVQDVLFEILEKKIVSLHKIREKVGGPKASVDEMITQMDEILGRVMTKTKTEIKTKRGISPLGEHIEPINKEVDVFDKDEFISALTEISKEKLKFDKLHKKAMEQNTAASHNNTDALKGFSNFLKLSVFIGTEGKESESAKKIRAYDIDLSANNPIVNLAG